jgi:tripartite-type tricarboxylate transporter receptor subunit TctC
VFPARTPQPIVQRMADETARVLGLADVQGRLHDLGYEPLASKPVEFGAFIAAEIARWANVIASAGIKRQ